MPSLKNLTSMEEVLAAALQRGNGQPQTKEELIARVWGDKDVSEERWAVVMLGLLNKRPDQVIIGADGRYRWEQRVPMPRGSAVKVLWVDKVVSLTPSEAAIFAHLFKYRETGRYYTVDSIREQVWKYAGLSPSVGSLRQHLNNLGQTLPRGALLRRPRAGYRLASAAEAGGGGEEEVSPRWVKVAGVVQELSRREADLIWFMNEHGRGEKGVGRREIMEGVWGQYGQLLPADSNAVDVLVSQLRRKWSFDLIQGLGRGQGWRLIHEAERVAPEERPGAMPGDRG